MRAKTVEQARGCTSGWRGKCFLKRQKARAERRKARRDPEAQPTYTRYDGYAS